MQSSFQKMSFLFVFVFTTAIACAQQNLPRHEFYAGYGFVTVQETQALFADIFGNNTETVETEQCFLATAIILIRNGLQCVRGFR